MLLSAGDAYNVVPFSIRDAVSAAPSSASGGADQHGTLTITAAPQPETAAMLLAGVAALGRLQRRRSV